MPIRARSKVSLAFFVVILISIPPVLLSAPAAATGTGLHIDSFTPTEGGDETTITITGGGFTDVYYVRLDGPVAVVYYVSGGDDTVVVHNDTSMSIVTNDSRMFAGSYSIGVSDHEPGWASICCFEYTGGQTPLHFDSFTPGEGGDNSTIVITGAGLAHLTMVSLIGPTTVSYGLDMGDDQFTFINETTVSLVTNDSKMVAGSYTIRGYSSLGQYEYICCFEYSGGQPPVQFDSFTPTSGGNGTTITLTGSGFTNLVTITMFGPNSASFSISSQENPVVIHNDTTVSFATDDSRMVLGSYSIRGESDLGQSAYICCFEYSGGQPPLVFESFSPDEGADGTTITMTGHGFASFSSISLYGPSYVTYAIGSEETPLFVHNDTAASLVVNGSRMSPGTYQYFTNSNVSEYGYFCCFNYTGTDLDGDGFGEFSDCDDANPAIHPGAYDVPRDGVDQNCNGRDASGITFYIEDLLTSNVRVAEHAGVTGDDRGPIALTGDRLLVAGDMATGAFNLEDLSPTGTTAVYDGLISDLRSGMAYTLATAEGPIDGGSSGEVTRLIELDRVSGALTGTEVVLSQSVWAYGGSLVLSGYGTMAVWHESNLFLIDPSNGHVQHVVVPWMPAKSGCDTWASWGVLEERDDQFAASFIQVSSIVRFDFQTGNMRALRSFDDLGDMCGFTISPATSRWYFHHEGSSQFNGGDETVGYADALVNVGDFLSEFAVTLTADAPGPRSDSAVFGVRSNATTGFDSGWDSPEPPAPADSAFVRAYFDHPANPNDTRRLHASFFGGNDELAWPLIVETAGPGGNTSVSWDSAAVASIDSNYDVELVDGLNVIDMRAATTYTFATPAGNASHAMMVRVRVTSDIEVRAEAVFVTPVVSVGGSVEVRGSLTNVGQTTAFDVRATLELDGVTVANVTVSPARLAPGQTGTFDFGAFNVTTPGEHTARITVSTSSPERTLSNNAVDVTYFGARHGVELLPSGSANGTVGLGEDFVYFAQVRNLGNIADSFTVTSSDVAPGWSVSGLPANVTLDANESLTFALVVTAPANLTGSPARLSLSITAWTSGNASDSFVATTSIVVQQALSLRAGWNLVSVAVETNDASSDGIFGGAVDRVVGWDGTMYTTAMSIIPGEGYWVLATEAIIVNVTGVPLTEVTWNLRAGWTLIGGPILATSSPIGDVVSWDGTRYVYGSNLAPGAGYWVYRSVAQSFVVVGSSQGLPIGPLANVVEGEGSWALPMSVSAPGSRSDSATVGVQPGATAGYDDGVDMMLAPRPADGTFAMAGLRAFGGASSARQHASLVGPSDAWAWALDVTTSGPGGVTMLSWSPEDVARIGAGYKVTLVDGERQVDMRGVSTYGFVTPAGEATRALTITVTPALEGPVCVLRFNEACVAEAPVSVGPVARWLP